ncbi:hypothetical protein HMPREF0476_1913 [Kingella kingae ATCC 23330]|uniref:Uncharacterized protein n=1 Tax=Kingella kingae ATCC 23330 TaxID=887327 RepID=F5S9N0_KINKI|nr:hypothetical protein HMPREF0476_1913 [Kingella kingae ATCC 23330]
MILSFENNKGRYYSSNFCRLLCHKTKQPALLKFQSTGCFLLQ